jgi:REP element-mobilizing transposase RayT
MEEHVHILLSLHPSVALAEFVKTVKVASSDWIKREHVFPAFRHWQDGYSAFTHALEDKQNLVDYIKDQQEHHRAKSFLEEYREMLAKAGLKFDERYLP